jgi:hypothetical protein
MKKDNIKMVEHDGVYVEDTIKIKGIKMLRKIKELWNSAVNTVKKYWFAVLDGFLFGAAAGHLINSSDPMWLAELSQEFVLLIDITAITIVFLGIFRLVHWLYKI